MSISFRQIPSNIRAPLAYLEVNGSNNSLNTTTNKRILVLGQKLAAGSATTNVPVLVSSYDEACSLFGVGSVLANMFEVLFKNNNFNEKWCVPSADDAGGTAATGSITVSGTATADGTVSLYMGGKLVSVAVSDEDTATEIGEAIEVAINALEYLPVTANNSSGTVTITHRHKGTVGNFYNMQLNYLGSEALPAGVSIAIVQMASGATDPSIATALAALPDQIFDYVLYPYQSSTILGVIEDEMEDRWDALRMLEGHAFGATAGSASAVAAVGAARNSKHNTLFDAGLNSPSPSYLWAAALVGQVAKSASADPALPMTTLRLSGLLAPKVADVRSLSQRNSLLYSGIATHTVDSGGNISLDRIITTYQTNEFDVADATWLDVNTPLTVAALRQSLRSRITTKFARKKLADDGNRFGVGSNVVTPSIIKSEIIAWGAEMYQLGYMENIAAFKEALIVERDVNDRTRVNASIPPDLVNQLYVFAGSISFIL